MLQCLHGKLSTSFTSSGAAKKTNTFKCLARQKYIHAFSHTVRILMVWLMPAYTYLLTPWSTVLLENITDPQPFKKFHAFYGNTRFTVVLTTAHHTFIFLARSIHFTPTSYVWNINFNVILLSTSKPSKWSLSLSLSLRFNHQNSVRTPPLPHKCYMPRPSPSSRF